MMESDTISKHTKTKRGAKQTVIIKESELSWKDFVKPLIISKKTLTVIRRNGINNTYPLQWMDIGSLPTRGLKLTYFEGIRKMTRQEIKKAEKLIEESRPAEGYSAVLYDGGNLGLECRYPDITKIFWTLDDVCVWICAYNRIK